MFLRNMNPCTRQSQSNIVTIIDIAKINKIKKIKNDIVSQDIAGTQ